MTSLILLLCALAQSSPAPSSAAGTSAPPTAAPAAKGGEAAAKKDTIDWRKSEAVLGGQVQLTLPERFVKAGEAYFNVDGTQVVFQAIERDAEGNPASEYYSMYVANLRDEGQGQSFGPHEREFRLRNIRQVSPPGSANTCGWFHPTIPNHLIFASTITPPAKQETPGYQRGTRNYRWSFPPEMRVVEVDLGASQNDPEGLKTLVGDGKAYTAECSTSPDGRTLLYTSLESGEGDIFVMDLPTKKITRIVSLPGYDGGAFFSPDGKKIVWRADRKGDNLLQIYVADVAFDGAGAVTGIGEPLAVTNDGAVNWAPYFTPDGSTLVYASSRVGHDNYELLALPVPTDRSAPPAQPHRVTCADGADLLPAITRDGKFLMWTSQRGTGRTSQLWLARISENGLLAGETVAPPAAEPSAPASTQSK
ncbi:MAG: hypothetical protein K8R92_11215 [Planctomycetes bacterium]|nr:hypothetical protein [Planctomycetota bacterium]